MGGGGEERRRRRVVVGGGERRLWLPATGIGRRDRDRILGFWQP